MVEIRNAEDLERWLEGKPPRFKNVIASRVALRLCAGIGLIIKEQNQKNGRWRNNIILPTMNLLLFSIAMSSRDIGLVEHIYSKFVNNSSKIIGLQHAGQLVDPSRVGAYLSFSCIERLSRIDRWDSDAGALLEAFEWPSLIFFPTSEDVKNFSGAISNDVATFDRGVDLWTQPLWLDDTPEWAVRGWETLATELTKRAPHWKTLVRWYEDRLHGDDWAAAQGRPAIPALEIARASLPDSYWKRGGKAVNEAIAKLENYFWNGVEIDDPVLRELVGQTPGRIEGIKVAEEAAELLVEVPAPPALPVQAHGPHFGLRDGLLDFAPPEHLDLAKNNIQRLKSLHPLLRAEAESAIEIFGRNMAHGRIHDALKTYAGLLDGDVTALNYDLIAGIGVKLQSEEAAAIAAIADGLEPSFERSETAAMKTLLDLHGPFILATEAGQTFVADAERWERNPRQEEQFRQSAIKLAEAIEADQIATPITANFVKEAAADIGLGPQPERSAVFGVGTVRNVSITIVSAAALYHPAELLLKSGALHSAAVAVGATVVAVAGGITTVLVYEGIKRSEPGLAVINRSKDAANAAFDRQTYRRFAEFVQRRWSELRDLAGNSREYQWLRDWLDWLKANPPE